LLLEIENLPALHQKNFASIPAPPISFGANRLKSRTSQKEIPGSPGLRDEIRR
jgi:hypothetical protein